MYEQFKAVINLVFSVSLCIWSFCVFPAKHRSRVPDRPDIFSDWDSIQIPWNHWWLLLLNLFTRVFQELWMGTEQFLPITSLALWLWFLLCDVPWKSFLPWRVFFREDEVGTSGSYWSIFLHLLGEWTPTSQTLQWFCFFSYSCPVHKVFGLCFTGKKAAAGFGQDGRLWCGRAADFSVYRPSSSCVLSPCWGDPLAMPVIRGLCQTPLQAYLGSKMWWKRCSSTWPGANRVKPGEGSTFSCSNCTHDVVACCVSQGTPPFPCWTTTF